MSIPNPEQFFTELEELDRRFALITGELVTIYPEYAAKPTDTALSEEFVRRQAQLHKVQADLFLLRDKLETAMTEISFANDVKELEIRAYDKDDKKLNRQLKKFGNQSRTAEGRLLDATKLYQKSYVSNLLLGIVVSGGIYITYKSIRNVSKA